MLTYLVLEEFCLSLPFPSDSKVPALLLVLSSREIIAVGNWHLLFQVILPKTAQLSGMAMQVSTISPRFPWQLRPSWWGDTFSWSKHTQIKSHKILEEKKIRNYAESLRVLYVCWSPPGPGWQINADLLYMWTMIACRSGWERQHPSPGLSMGQGKVLDTFNWYCTILWCKSSYKPQSQHGIYLTPWRGERAIGCVQPHRSAQWPVSPNLLLKGNWTSSAPFWLQTSKEKLVS